MYSLVHHQFPGHQGGAGQSCEKFENRIEFISKTSNMLRNYLKIAWRNLVKNRTFSVINMAGLAIGLSCFLLIAMYVMDELSYDRFNKNADRIYRIQSDITFGGTALHLAVSPDITGEILKKDYPQVEQYTRIYNSNGAKLIRKGNEYINERNVVHADSTLFDVFTLPAVAGDTKTALNEPNTVVMTSTAAKKYFGTTDVLGKTIETNDDSSTVYKITAVINDIPKNSHFHADLIFSMKNVQYGWGNLLSHNFFTYLLLKKGTDPKQFEKNFSQYIDKYVMPQAKQYMDVKSMDDFKKAGNSLSYTLMPLTKIHLHSDTTVELGTNSSIQYVYIFSAVALFILLIACINFMNLTTARSANRAREVGIRKVLGTERRKLIAQFLSESTIMVLISMLIAIAITWLVLPMFNNLSTKSIGIETIFAPQILPFFIILPFLVGLIAGSYPAFYLSGFKPIQVLKGAVAIGGKRTGLRSVLVVFQFCISIILIIGTIVIYKQLNYIQTTNLGFKKDQVLIINDAYALDKNADAFKNEMLNTKGVISGTMSSFLPVASSRNDNSYSTEATMDVKNGLNMQTWRIDYDYLKTLGMELVKGRNFSKDFGSDSSAIILNETAAAVLGPGDPSGKKLYALNGPGQPTTPYTVVGVVKNFHFESLRQTIGPLSFLLSKSIGLASFKVSAANVPSILRRAETNWKAMAPGKPFSYRFLDDSFMEIYEAEQRMGRIALIFSVIAIFIACLGLFGLATFIAEQRTREIGIRKVLGASVRGIIQLLSKDFLKLVIIAFVFAVPLAWWFMHRWLQDFAYRISIGWWIFVAAGVSAMLIALFTVSFQAIRAAISNPVKSLRTE
jgi:putative ABC transport system permease protein